MSSRRRQQQRPITSTDWLLPHRERFLKDIADQGYSGGTLTHYSGATSQFCKEVAKRGLRQGQLFGSELSKVCAAVLKGNQYHTQSYKRSCVKRFVDNLAEGGVAKRPKPARQRPAARDRLRTEYETYLQVQRGLSEATIQNRLNFFDRFMTFRFGAKLGNLNAITPDNLVAFLRKVLFRPRSFRDTSPPTHLRALFRFLFWIGKTKHDLAASLPSVARPRDTHLPRSLKPKEIERLIDAAWSADAPGRRNYAMLLVMARLGLRAPEVIAIKLDDIDWRAGTILIRGKGKRHDHMPLPEDVGGDRRLHPQRPARRHTDTVRRKQGTIPPIWQRANRECRAGDGVQGHRSQTTAKIHWLASAAAQLGDRHAAQRRVPRRDWRRAAAPLAQVDGHLRQTRY